MAINPQVVSDITNTVLLGLGILVGIGLTVFLGWWVWYLMQFKYPVHVFDLADGGKIYREDKGAIFIDRRTKGPFLILKGSREKILGQIPPQAKHQTSTGKFMIEVYRTGPGEFVYRIDKINYIISKGATLPDGQKAEETCVLHDFYPVSAQQRAALIDELERAYSRERKKAIDYLLPIAGILGIIIILAVLLMFGKGAVEPFMEVSSRSIEIMTKLDDQNAAQHERYMQILDKLDMVVNDKQLVPKGLLANETIKMSNETNEKVY